MLLSNLKGLSMLKMYSKLRRFYYLDSLGVSLIFELFGRVVSDAGPQLMWMPLSMDGLLISF